VTTWALTKYRRFPVPIRPRRIIQLKTRIARKAKREADRQQAISKWLAVQMFGERNDRPWWRRFL